MVVDSPMVEDFLFLKMGRICNKGKGTLNKGAVPREIFPEKAVPETIPDLRRVHRLSQQIISLVTTLSPLMCWPAKKSPKKDRHVEGIL